MLILLTLYVILPLVQYIFFINGQFGIGLTDMINFGTSIFALHWLLANIIISSKIPLLQKTLPYDLRIRYHIFSTTGIVFAVLYHAIYKFVLGYEIDPITWALLAVIVLLLTFSILWIPLPNFKKLRALILRKFKSGADLNYDKSKNGHRFFIFIIGGLLLLHIISAGLFVNVNIFSSILYGALYTGSFGMLILSTSDIFKVKSEIIEVITNRDIIVIKLKPCRSLRYKSGQFTFLETLNESKKREEHPFSFLSHSLKKDEKEEVSIAVRAIGDFTKNLSNLKPGDMVKLRGAFGHFRPQKENALCFIASGIGTVPIISIFKELNELGDSRPINLFLAVDHKEEMPEMERVLDLASKMDNVKLHFMVYQEDGLRFSEEFFREKLVNPTELTYYLCSSPGVRNIVVDALSNLGVKKRAIHFEAFTFG